MADNPTRPPMSPNSASGALPAQGQGHHGQGQSQGQGQSHLGHAAHHLHARHGHHRPADPPLAPPVYYGGGPTDFAANMGGIAMNHMMGGGGFGMGGMAGMAMGAHPHAHVGSAPGVPGGQGGPAYDPYYLDYAAAAAAAAAANQAGGGGGNISRAGPGTMNNSPRGGPGSVVSAQGQTGRPASRSGYDDAGMYNSTQSMGGGAGGPGPHDVESYRGNGTGQAAKPTRPNTPPNMPNSPSAAPGSVANPPHSSGSNPYDAFPGPPSSSSRFPPSSGTNGSNNQYQGYPPTAGGYYPDTSPHATVPPDASMPPHARYPGGSVPPAGPYDRYNGGPPRREEATPAPYSSGPPGYLQDYPVHPHPHHAPHPHQYPGGYPGSPYGPPSHAYPHQPQRQGYPGNDAFAHGYPPYGHAPHQHHYGYSGPGGPHAQVPPHVYPGPPPPPPPPPPPHSLAHGMYAGMPYGYMQGPPPSMGLLHLHSAGNKRKPMGAGTLARVLPPPPATMLSQQQQQEADAGSPASAKRRRVDGDDKSNRSKSAGGSKKSAKRGKASTTRRPGAEESDDEYVPEEENEDDQHEEADEDEDDGQGPGHRRSSGKASKKRVMSMAHPPPHLTPASLTHGMPPQFGPYGGSPSLQQLPGAYPLLSEAAAAAVASYPGIPQSMIAAAAAHAHLATTGAATPVAIPGPPPAMSAVMGHGHKRKYRRHPKTDPNEPQKPQSAYVVFANEVRAELRDMKLSFSELAKIVGERWKNMSPDEKRAREEAASRAKHEYHQALGMYRQSPAYVAYQAYLREFEAAAALAGRAGSVEPTVSGKGRKSKTSASKKSGKNRARDDDQDDEVDELEPDGALADGGDHEANCDAQQGQDQLGGSTPARQQQQGPTDPGIVDGGAAPAQPQSQQGQPFLTAPVPVKRTLASPLAPNTLMLQTSILSDNVDATLALIPAPILDEALPPSVSLAGGPQTTLTSTSLESPLPSVSSPAQQSGGAGSPSMEAQQQPAITFSASPKDLTVSGQVTPTTSATTMAPAAVGVDGAGKSEGQLDGFL